MQNKKIGTLIIVLTIVSGLFLLSYLEKTKSTGKDSGCIKSECSGVFAIMNSANIGLGLLFGLLSLGIYLVFFSKGEQALLEYIEREKASLGKEEKLRVIAMLLDPNEKKVFDVIRENEGITQHMIRIKTDLSKATVSEVLSAFEKKNIINKVSKGKTYSVFLTENI